MAGSSILLLENDQVSGALIRTTLTALGHTLDVVPTAAEALEKATGNELVIIDVVDQGSSAQEICGLIRRTANLAATPILCICQTDDVEERVRFLESGADDVMVKPIDPRELEARVEALLLRLQRTRELAQAVEIPTVTRGPRVLTCFSPRGGAGTTTIAVNIAVLAAADRPDRVAIIDLDLQFGQVSTHLNLIPRMTLGELLRDDAALHDPGLLRSYAHRTPEGLHVIAAPRSPSLDDEPPAGIVQALIEGARRAYETVIIDAGPGLSPRVLASIELADRVLIPVTPEIPTLRAVRALLDLVPDLGATGAPKPLFVLNHLFARDMLRSRDVESALNAPISTELPYDPVAYLKAANEGVPLVRSAPRTPAAQSLALLTGSLFGGESSTPQSQPQRVSPQPQRPAPSAPVAPPPAPAPVEKDAQKKRGLFGR